MVSMKGFILGVIFTALAFTAWPKLGDTLANASKMRDDPQVKELRRFVEKNFADPDSELVTVTEPVDFQGNVWRLVKVRTTNKMGGRIFANYFVQFYRDTPDKFIRDDELDKLPGSTREESQAFNTAFRGVGEIDVRRK